MLYSGIRDVDRDSHNRLVNAWMFGVLAFIYTCALDWDHVWFFILKVTDPFNLTGIQGRPFHTVSVFLLYAVVVAVGITAFIVRQHVMISPKHGNIPITVILEQEQVT